MELTDQQKDIVSAFGRGESFAMRAGAGTGKTSTIEACFSASPKKALAAAFNRKIAEELGKRLPSEVSCKTLNGLGHMAWTRHIGRRPDVNGKKTWDAFGSYKFKTELADRAVDLVKLVGLAKTHGISSGFNAPMPDVSLWEELAVNFDIDEADVLIPHAATLLKESAKQAFQGVIDFDDQIYMSVLYGSPFQKYDCVAGDEAQDWSALQHEIIARSLAKGGQLIIAGDRNQAIYGFRGASENSFDELEERFGLKELPLMNSFRCPIKVVGEANKYVPDLRAASKTLGELKTIEHYPLVEGNKTVLSRFNSNLVTMAFKAIREGIGINYLGRDFLSGLKALYKKHPTMKDLEAWKAEQMAKVKSVTAKKRVEDRFLTLAIVFNEAKNRNKKVEELLDELNFSKRNGALILATIHGAKGLEWPDVTYFDYFSEIEGSQENNIKYVGVTRSMNKLTLHDEGR